MAVSVAAVMRHIRNYFDRGYRYGDFTIIGGALTPAPDSAYVYIAGSVLHDGVWALSGDMLQGVPDGLRDESFSGRVYELHPPDDFLRLCGEISEYDDKNPVGALQSESFGDYSYTRASVQGGAQGWQAAFRPQLDAYRRMVTEVGE